MQEDTVGGGSHAGRTRHALGVLAGEQVDERERRNARESGQIDH